MLRDSGERSLIVESPKQKNLKTRNWDSTTNEACRTFNQTLNTLVNQKPLKLIIFVVVLRNVFKSTTNYPALLKEASDEKIVYSYVSILKGNERSCILFFSLHELRSWGQYFLIPNNFSCHTLHLALTMSEHRKQSLMENSEQLEILELQFDPQTFSQDTDVNLRCYNAILLSRVHSCNLRKWKFIESFTEISVQDHCQLSNGRQEPWTLILVDVSLSKTLNVLPLWWHH